ncbi:MAG TPA: PEP-CTERM sorting domain-containing protein [Pirellulales bacterium]
MKRAISLVLALGLVALVSSWANATVIIDGATNNGYLDQTHAVEVVPGFFLPQPSVWTNSASRTITGSYLDDLSSETFAGGPPTPATTGNFSNPPNPDGCGNTATDGDCGVFFKPFSGNLTTDGLATAHLFQDNPATAGLTYQMTGWAGAEANALMTDATFSIRFLNATNADIGGATLSLLPTLFVPNGQPFNYKNYVFGAVAPAGTVTVRADIAMIGAQTNPLGGGQAFVVDDVSLSSCVPEPASVSLVLMGMLGLVGLVRRR